MAMHVEKYTTRGESIPAATKILRLLGVLLTLLIILMTRRSGRPISSSKPAGKVSFTAAGVSVSAPAEPGFRWDTGTHLVRTHSRILTLSPDLKPLFRTNFGGDLRFIADDNGFVTYRKVGKGVTAHSPLGEKRFFFPTRAYPRSSSSPKMLFLITGDQSGIGFLRSTGHLSGTFQQIGAPITAYDYNSTESCAYFGQISGYLEKYNVSSGKTAWRKKTAGSRISMVKGLSVTPDGNHIALVSGLYPERFSLLDPSGNVAWSVRTGGNVKTAVAVKAGTAFCAGYTDTSMYLLDRVSGNVVYRSRPSDRSLPIRFLDMASSPDGRRTLVSWGNRARSGVILVDRQGTVQFYRSFPSPYAFVRFCRSGRAFSIQTDRDLTIYTEGELL